MPRDLARDSGLTLYPAQQEALDLFRRAGRRRMILAYGTGCGKTPTALKCLEALARGELATLSRVLVVCPAMVRRHWAREAAVWLGVFMHPIEHGRRRALGKMLAAQRDAAYRAMWSVVSYDLLPQVDAQHYGAIILDEVHHIAHWHSKQSGAVRTLMQANPNAAVLGLSATLIPTEVKQLWHPLHAIFGGAEWGRLPRTGEVNYQFAQRYCRVEHNGYGLRIFGGNEQHLPELRDRVKKVAHRITRENIAVDLPPLSVRMLDVSGTDLSAEGLRCQQALNAHSARWVQDLPEDIHHAVVLFYHRERAHELVAYLRAHDLPHLHIDGTITTAKRVEILEQAEAMPRCILVATSESIREGVRLMWAQKVLLAEWRQSPVQVIQVLGRFQSVGSTARPEVEVLTDESLYGAANTLIARSAAINAVLAAGKIEKVVQEVFAPKDMTEARLAELTRSMMAEYVDPDTREEWTDSDESEF